MRGDREMLDVIDLSPEKIKICTTCDRLVCVLDFGKACDKFAKKKRTEPIKVIAKIDLSGEVVEIFPSISSACREIKCMRETLRYAIENDKILRGHRWSEKTI